MGKEQLLHNGSMICSNVEIDLFFVKIELQFVFRISSRNDSALNVTSLIRNITP